jgi:hypothetical protein
VSWDGPASLMVVLPVVAGMPIPVHIDTRKDLFPRKGTMRVVA